MNRILYPNTFTPDHEEKHELEGVEYSIPAVSLPLKKWEGQSIQNTFGGKPLVDYEGKPMFTELAFYHMAIKDGWSARWVETYATKKEGPCYFTDWLDAPLTWQINEKLDDVYQEELMKKMALQNNGSYSGCWDVLVWKDNRTFFWNPNAIRKILFEALSYIG